LNLPTTNTENTVILTGASGKIGIRILKILLDSAFSVIALFNKNENVLKVFVDENPNFKEKIILQKIDFNTQVPEIYELMQKYKNNISVLINCAAIFEKGNLKSTDNLLKIMQINDFSALSLTEKYAEIVKKGNIINILDGNIFRFNENYQNYRISKLFLLEVTKQSAILFAPEIRVNAIAFGMLEETAAPSNTFALQKEILKNKVSNENIANTLKFLLDSENITGQTIFLDNGAHLL
jgi:NAD(P)-dependent dehydrogenase (short-subunit alcohol dehydrogenase family)